MIIKRIVYLMAASTLTVGMLGTVVSCKKAEDGTAEKNVATEVVAAQVQTAEEEMVDLLFVQYAESVSLSDGVLTLKGISPEILYFSDRPDRIVGRQSTRDFIKSWGEGEGSFSEVPPNAVLAVMAKPVPLDLVVVLKDPVLEGDTLTYQVKVLDGPDSGEGAASALFIDLFHTPVLDAVGDSARETARRIEHRVTDYGDSYDDDYDDPDDRDAYRDGYKDAWYDDDYDDDFDDSDERHAYQRGYEDGKRDASSFNDDYDDPDDRDAYREGYEDGKDDNRFDNDDYDDRDERDAYRDGYEDGQRDRD